MSKALRFLQITAKHQGCPFLTVFLAIKTSYQNISITLSQISLELDKHRGRYWRKMIPLTILEEQFLVPRYIAASKIGNSVISLLWQLRCRCNPNHNKFSSLSNTTVVAIFPNLCLWRRSLWSNLGGPDPQKLYRATFIVKFWWISLRVYSKRTVSKFRIGVSVHALGVKREIRNLTSRSLNENKESTKNKACCWCKVVVLLI